MLMCTLIVVASSDGSAKLWSMSNGEVIQTYKHNKAVVCCALNDGAEVSSWGPTLLHSVSLFISSKTCYLFRCIRLRCVHKFIICQCACIILVLSCVEFLLKVKLFFYIYVCSLMITRLNYFASTSIMWALKFRILTSARSEIDKS